MEDDLASDDRMPALLTRLLRSAISARGTLESYRVIGRRPDYAVVAATMGDPALSVVVKLAGPHAAIACPFERTAAINQRVRERTAVPTFAVLAVDVSYRTWPWRYMVMTHEPGITWSEAGSPGSTGMAPALYPQLGRIVAELQTLRFPACGEIDANGTVIQGAPYLPALADRARRRIANPRHADLFIALLDERAALFSAMAGGSLSHEDLNPHNILVAEREGRWLVTAILDFDSAWAGSAESDLARLEFWRGMTGAGFHEAYEAIAPIAVGYADRRPIYQLLWCLEYASASPQHQEDTAAVCATLGIAPIRFP